MFSRDAEGNLKTIDGRAIDRSATLPSSRMQWLAEQPGGPPCPKTHPQPHLLHLPFHITPVPLRPPDLSRLALGILIHLFAINRFAPVARQQCR